MELNKCSFPVKVTLEEAISKFQKEFDKKGYKVKITKENLHLNIVPYWVCFYDIDCRIDNKYHHISGQTALNSLTNKIEDEFLILLEKFTPRVLDSIDVFIERVEIRVKKSLVSIEETKETVTKMLSCKFNVEKTSISLSGFEEMYIPIWRCDIDNLELYFDAVMGKINNLQKLGKIKKSDSALFTEMMSDLKDPKKLFKYIADFFIGIFDIALFFLRMLIKYWYINLIVLLAVVIYFFFL